MVVALRYEQAPAMRFVHVTAFGDALREVTEDNSDGSDAISSLNISNAMNDHGYSYADAKIADVIHALWFRRDVMHINVFNLRVITIAPICNDVKEISNQFQHHMQSIVPKTYPTSNRELPVRRLRVNDSGLQSKDLKEISALLCGNATLATIALNGNDLLPQEPYIMKRLACAISMSNLRVLELSNNMIGTRSLVELLDNLHTPSLTRLALSMTFLRKHLAEDQSFNPLWAHDKARWSSLTSAEVWKEEVGAVTDRLVTLVRHDKPAPFVPHLEWLSLNGNDLGWRTVKRITAAIRDTNRCLEHVELFSTTDAQGSKELDNDTDDELETGEDQAQQSAPPAQENGVRRSTSIGSHFVARRRQQIAQDREERQNAPLLLTWHPEDVGESRPPLNKTNWRKELEIRLKENRQAKAGIKNVSRKLLRILRTLTCKCHEAKEEPSDGSFPFTKLPPEIRQRIVMHLDGSDTLSHKQIERIISFASDPSTIGYGRRSSNLGLSRLAVDEIYKEVTNKVEEITRDDYGLLLHKKFRWKDMMNNYSVPRDWPATLLDDTTSSCSNESSIGDYSQGNVTLVSSNTQSVGRTRQIWLAEQSGLQAYYEATGTYCAD
ncbi:uncharacterized protein FA14DRAFT_179656 [Meira miltonrushii]|uniref:RNI-like protein n=1 Tax=Meira miltonrushii TaxID=1280837 RepID=A0A316VFK0_9BASI|nr:uncharacterized protein FA14DRAFT_179656 [Meira miltonrushii]PWN36296.1 hypothetical protein FA14DRAFT_179656 [Meira miltonrushii]